MSILNDWRYYSLEQEEYKKCMGKTFVNNLYSLRQANVAVAVFASLFTLFPLLVEKNYFKSGIHLTCAAIAVLLCVFVSIKINQHEKGKPVSNKLVYTMILLYYTNAILFGIYLGVFANPTRLAVSFMGILICALFLFNIPSLLNICLTACALTLFITATVLVKHINEWEFDVINSLFAGCVSQFFGWQIIKYRMWLASTATKIEDERNSYYNQSTIDELTQLKNRRDFSQTFERFLFSYRQSDNFMCIAILDIDFFKNYNDHYGHIKGDKCLHTIGIVLNDLSDIYAARVGGEEFALIWFENNAENARNVASQINQKIRDLNIPHKKSNAASYITISIGVHVTKCGTHHDTQSLYDLADKALYAAKSGGRDRAVITFD